MNNVFIVHGWVLDAIRMIFSAIDSIIYELFAIVVAIFYNVATAQLISGTIMHDFFSRIQLIIGIIVMFKVATSFFMGILNPETISDKKNGFGGIIKRVIIVLVMIVLIVPLDIPGVDIDDISDSGQTSWNARMNASGIAFGTLYELQARLLKGNTIAKLILGVDGSQDNDEWVESGLESGENLARIVFKSFFTIAKYEGEPICQASDNTKLKKAYDLYLDDDTSIAQILGIVNYTCEDGEGGIDSFLNWIDVFDLFDSGNFYAFSYSFLFSTVVGVFCVIIFVSYTVDAAIRLIKLTILYLISPIPILSYIDPKTEKNFHNWLKVVGSTYIDLFVRLAIVYMIIFLIREVDGSLFNGTNDFIAVEDGVIGIFSKIFIILGLLMFAREAPKFISETLGFQKNAGLFGGLASLMGGVTSTIQGFKASQDAYRENHEGKEITAASRIRSTAAGLINGAGGMGRAYNDYTNAKEHKFRSSLDKINQQNAIRRANGAQGVTFGQTLMAQARQDATGYSRYHELQRMKEVSDSKIKKAEAQAKAFQNLQKTYSDPLTEIAKRIKDKGAIVNHNGERINMRQLEAEYQHGLKTGNWKHNGADLTVEEFKRLYDGAEKQALNEYMKAAVLGSDQDRLNYQASAGVEIIADHITKLKAAQKAYNVAYGAGSFGGTGDLVVELKAESGSLSDKASQALAEAAEIRNGTVPIGRETVSYSDLEPEIEKERRILTGSDGQTGKGA